MIFFLASLGVFAGIVLAELLARLYSRHTGYYPRRRWERILMLLDQRVLPGLEAQVRFETNGEGERGGPLPRDREGLYRVLVAGGSAVECALLDQDSAWPAVVGQLLNQPEALQRLKARQVHVGNIGKALLPLSGVKMILERSLPRYDKLDLAVLMVGASDAIDWLELETPAEIPAEHETGRLFGESPEVTFGWRPRQTALWKIVACWYRRFGGQTRFRQNGGSRVNELRQRRSNARRWVSEYPNPEPMLSQMEKDLRAVVQMFRARGTRVLIVRQPWVDRPLSADEEKLIWNYTRGRMSYHHPVDTYYTFATVQRLLRETDRRIARLVRELDVESVNLMPLLEPSLRNYYDFQHFTPQGAQEVAAHTAAAILGTAALPEPVRLNLLEHTAQ